MTAKLVNNVGNWVSGPNFWDREQEVTRLTELLDEGQHLLIVAPRRVGKTSLVKETMQRMADRGRDYDLFVDLQGCTRPEDSVVALSLATRHVRSLWSKTVETFSSVFEHVTDRVDSLGLDMIELKLREGTAEAWQQRGNKILENLAQADRRVVLCLDELPVMLSRMMCGPGGHLDPEGVRSADLFLSWLRKCCGEHQGAIRLIICGSIGLEPVVHRAGLSHSIAHLRAFSLLPWDRETADSCLQALAAEYGLNLPQEVRDAMLDHLRSYVPHHVQMYFGHVHDDCRRRSTLEATPSDARRVYEEQMLGPRGHAELADYEERLRRVLGPELIALALELLTEAAVQERLTGEAAQTLARQSSVPGTDHAANLSVVLDVLEHDGYLFRRLESDSLAFVSGLVRDWWRRRFGHGYVPVANRGARSNAD